jgi:hypothetical protein
MRWPLRTDGTYATYGTDVPLVISPLGRISPPSVARPHVLPLLTTCAKPIGFHPPSS